MSYQAALHALEPLLQSGPPEQARQQLAMLIENYPQSPELHYRMAVLCQAQAWPEAEDHYCAVLAQAPNHAPSWFGRGFLAFRASQFELSESHLRQALKCQPDFVLALDYLAQICAQKGVLEEAVQNWERCAQLAPDVRWHPKLIFFYQRLNNWQQASRHVQAWLGYQPENADAWNEAGLILIQLRQPERARQAFERALVVDPEFVDVYTNLGHLARNCGQTKEALTAYRRAVEVKPEYAQGWYNLAQALVNNSQAELAQEALREAFEREPALLRREYKGPAINPHPRSDQALLQLRQAMTLPLVYASHHELECYRETLSKTLENLRDVPLQVLMPERELSTLTPFYLAYQGQNDRDLNQQLATLLSAVVPADLSRQKTSGRFKIGLISAFFQDHSVMHCFGSMIMALAAEVDFDVILFLTPGSQPDRVTHALKDYIDKMIALPRDLSLGRQIVADQCLDLLIYPELGMDSFSWLLALTRLAPTQAVLSGHPITSGIPTIDYFISHQSLETPQSDTHYTEKLICLPGVPVNYTTPPQRSFAQSRLQLGLSEQKHLYLCPMTLFKLHPDFDLLLKGILDADPLAEILVFKYHHSLIHEILKARFEKMLDLSRIRILPWAPWEKFMAILTQSDVLLDTPHFGGGNTLYLAFNREIPVVTWPSAFQRGRGGLGLYRAMGLDFGVATDLQDYIQRAVQLASDRSWNQFCRSEIARKKYLLFGQTESTQALLAWVKGLAAQRS
jgi:protein O-GlcNAc transferase